MSSLCSRLIVTLMLVLSLFGCQTSAREIETRQASTTNPALITLATTVRQVRVAQSARILAMTPAERTSYLEQLVALRSAMEDGGEAELAQFTELTGITGSQLQTLRQQTLAFKQSSTGSGPVTSDLPALDDDESIDGIDGGGDVSDCIDDCNDAYDHTAVVAEVVYIKVSLGCILAAPATSPIGTILCGAAALIDLAATMAIADKNRDDCIDICNGVNPDGECSDDNDCDSSEFCWEGPLGFGDNECRDKKELGQVCSRDGKCESGCCKYDFWVNPIQFSCQPASDCN